jgi:hypothetical protein
MSERVNAFANLKDVPVFEVKSKPDKPVAKDAADRMADDNGFLSRQPRKASAAPVRKRRVYRTGRNRNFSLKATNEAVERFYKIADERKITLGALLELALDALDGTGGRTSSYSAGG